MEKRIIRRTAAVIFSLFMVIAAVFGTDVGLRKVWAADNVTLTMHNATAVSVNNNVATVTVNGGTATVSLDAGTMQLSGTQDLQIAGATKATFTLSVSDGFNYSNGGSIVVGGARIQEDGNHQYELALSENQVKNIDFQFVDANNNGGNTGGNNGNQTPPANNTIQVAFGNGTVNGRTVTYNVNNTDVVITLADSVPLNNNEATVTLDNKVLTGMTVGNTFDAAMMEMKLTATDGFNCVVEANAGVLSHKANGGLPGGTLTFSISPKNSNSNNNPQDPDPNQNGAGAEPEQMRYALLINVNGTQYRVDPDTNIINLPDADISDMQFMIDEFIDLNDDTHIPLQNVGSNSGATDSEGRNPLEIQTPVENAHTANRWVMNINYHSGDDPILANRNCPEFYFTNLTFVSSSYKGVQVSFSKKPDMYQDTVYTDKVDIAGTTADNPARTGVYYDSDDFTLTDVGGVPVQSIQVTDKINPNAVTITGNTVRFNSGFYASIPLVVTLADGTTGYLTVERLGLEIDMVPTTGPAARSATHHGSQPGIALSASSEASTYNIVGIYYYDAANSYTDFDLVAKLVFPDGHVETKVVSGYAEKANNDPSLKAGDYMVWSGTSMDNMPVTVSVTAVRHGATGGSSFGGALFGAGAGLTKSNLH